MSPVSWLLRHRYRQRRVEKVGGGRASVSFGGANRPRSKLLRPQNGKTFRKMPAETVFVAGISRRPWYKKLNPFWWFGNDEQSAQGNTLYYKYIRNPLQNFRWYVVGVVDRPHYVTGRAPAIANERGDLKPPQPGWCISVIWLGQLPVLPYVSFSSRRLTFQIGWQPSGGFSLKLNFSNSAFA